MRRMIDRILKSCGSWLRLEHQGQVTEFRGFLQPIRSRDKQNREHVIREPGEYPIGQYVYIGPAEVQASEGDAIYRDGRRFVLRRAEKFFVGDDTVYCWGICVEEEEDTWTES